jgi:DNA cross-link repair 1C protein
MLIPGCLTADENARIHSCDPEIPCSVMASRKAVFIMPIVTHTDDGSEVPEFGAGGGIGDLYQSHELELLDESAVKGLQKLCLEQIKDIEILSETRAMINSAFESGKRTLSLDKYGIREDDNMSLKEFVTVLSRGLSKGASSFSMDSMARSDSMSTSLDKAGNELPTVVVSYLWFIPYGTERSMAKGLLIPVICSSGSPTRATPRTQSCAN